jgi:uncharacterized protein (TIGR00251 family)
MLTRLKVRVVPDARRNEIAGFFQGEVRLKVKASAQEGKANAEVIRFLAELIDCQRSKIAIKQGEKSRNKMIEITDVNPAEVQRKLVMHRKQKPEAGI